MRCSLVLSAIAASVIWVGAIAAEVHSGTEVLVRRCVQCHGPTQQMGDLALSSRGAALAGGTRGPAIVPGDPSASLILARVAADEMPPGAPLSSEDKQVLRDWIAAGAEWPGTLSERRAGSDWWSLQPLGNTTPPESVPDDWQQSPIDRWIYSALDEKGLRPSPEADRRDLIRRISFSLIGLPPEPAEVDAFLADQSPHAYEELVDQLLASPHYGERWARHWLDIVRFAESEGFERDVPRDHVWPYRDYVIRSFNRDKSYLQFAREQIAGDVMRPVTRDGVAATTMLTLGPVDAIGLTSAVLEERMAVREDLLEEMLGTVTQTFLGLTVNCARCHDHKFDPISQEEYYRMKAAFQAVWAPTKPNPSAGLDGLFPYGRPLLSEAEQRRRDAQVREIEDRLRQIGADVGSLYRAAQPARPLGKAPLPLARWTFDTDGRADYAPLHLTLVGRAALDGGSLGLPAPPVDETDGNVREAREAAAGTGVGVSEKLAVEIREKTLEVWLDVQSVPEKSEILMEIRSLSGYRGASVDGIQFVPGENPHWENFSIGSFRSKGPGAEPAELPPGERLHLAISYTGDGTIRMFRDGKPLGAPYRPDDGVPAGRLQTYRSGDALVRFPASRHIRVAEARLYGEALSPVEIRASFEAGIRDDDPNALRDRMTPDQRDRLASLEHERIRLDKELKTIPQPELVHAAAIQAGEPTHVLTRGAVDQPGERVWPAGLECVQGLPADFGLGPDAPEATQRLAMAEWIAHPSNPLFSRVIANRIWQGHFGRGFVANPSDFGYNGGQPTHPELLDWLASELVRNGWSLKALHRQILLSRTYRQSSRFDEGAASVDAENRLLWRFNPRRLEAESVRDSMLAASGDLNRAIFGPSFRPFKFGERRGSLRSYLLTADDSPALRRRTVYRMNVITGGDPMLESLDCPLPSTKTPRRRSTTTPLQALSLMNNSFVHHRAQGFAARLQREARDPDTRIRLAFQLALGREPASSELAESLELVRTGGLESLCWGLFNTSEFLYVR